MKTCPEELIDYMHDYLDGDITSENEQKLKHHLQQCEECQHHFHELKKAIAFVQSTSHISAPDDFTNKVMDRLPKEKKKVGRRREMAPPPSAADGGCSIHLLYDRKCVCLME